MLNLSDLITDRCKDAKRFLMVRLTATMPVQRLVSYIAHMLVGINALHFKSNTYHQLSLVQGSLAKVELADNSNRQHLY